MTPSKIDIRSLRKLSSLSTLPQITLEKLAAHLRVRAVKQKTQIFDQGDAGRTVYLLISGIEGSLGSTRRIDAC